MSGEPSREIFTYIRERDEARANLKKVEDELQDYQSKLYDANSKIESLKKSLANAQKAAAANSGQKGAPAKAAPAAAGKGKGTAAKGGDKAKAKAPAASTPNDTPAPTPPPARAPTAVRHPPIPGKEELSEDTYEYYCAIGELFPLLPMTIILNAEKKFNLADVDGNGFVDREEIDNVLSKTDVALFTSQQVEEIIKEIDKDDTGDLDFCEVLKVLEKMGRRRNAKLPAAINDNKDKICAIQ